MSTTVSPHDDWAAHEQPDGSRTQKIMPLNALSSEPWRYGRTITYMSEPVDPEMAMAHLLIFQEDGAVVLAKRGPKGGWNNLRYVDLTNTSAGALLRATKRGFTLYVGRVHPQNVMRFRRYTPLTYQMGAQTFLDAAKTLKNRQEVQSDMVDALRYAFRSLVANPKKPPP